MTGSSLVTKHMQAYAGNYTKGRSRYGKITEITVHHCAGIMSIDDLGRLWQRVGREGSSHYGVSGTQIGQYVSEDDIAWTNSHWASNCRAVTIETSNSGGAPNWPVADDTLQTLIKLVADIAKRNGLHPLALGKTLTWHSMYAATACPGPCLKGKLQYIVDEANKLNEQEDFEMVQPLSPDNITMQIGPASSGDRALLKHQAQSLGLGYSEGAADGSGNALVYIGPASSGDQRMVLTKAAELGLGYCIYTPPAETPDEPDKPAEDDVEALRAELEAAQAEAQALRNSLASMTAERDAAVQRAEQAEAQAQAAAERAERAEKDADTYLQKIEAARAALED